MGKRKTDPGAQRLEAKRQRRERREGVGQLRDTRVKPQTLVRYDRAVATFFDSLRDNNETLVADHLLLDEQVCVHIERLWNEGESRSLAEDCLSGLRHYQPKLRGQLRQAWDLVSAWQNKEPALRATPADGADIQAFAGLALASGDVEMATAICVAFHCFLRSGEMGNATLGDFVLNAPGTVYNLDPGYTKGGSRRREREAVGIDDPTCLSLIRLCKARGRPGDKLLRGGTVEFRRKFHSIIETLTLEHKNFQLYSFRRGGATAFFRATNNLPATAVRGRWSSQKTARQYIDAAAQDLKVVEHTHAQRQQLAHYRGEFLRWF